MSLRRSIECFPPSMQVELPRVYVVSWLANANGVAVTEATRANATYIATAMCECEDDAWARWDELQTAGALFASCQDDTGESIV